MKSLKLLLLWLVAWMTPWLAQAADKEMTTPPITVQVQVDAQGRLAEIKPLTKLGEPFDGIIQRALAHWTFDPARVDGKPVVTTTWLAIDLKAQVHDNGDAAVQVRYLGNGPDVLLAEPAYPDDMLRRGREATIIVHATVGIDGHLSDVAVSEALTSNGVYAREFVDASVTAVTHSTAQPIMVDGKPVVSRVSIPLHFKLHEIGKLNPRQLAPADDASRFVKPATAVEQPAFADDVDVAIDSPIKPLSTPGS